MRKPESALLSAKSLTALGNKWVGEARKMARRLLLGSLANTSTDRFIDGYMLRATRTGRIARGVVIDPPQMLLCPTGVRLPIGTVSFVYVGGAMVAVGERDRFQPAVEPAQQVPEYPAPESWMIGLSVGYSFGDSETGWDDPTTYTFSTPAAGPRGCDMTHQATKDRELEDWYFNASNPAVHRFSTRNWTLVRGPSRAAVEEMTGAFPPSAQQANMLTFTTTFVDSQALGWAAIPRADSALDASNPPEWAQRNDVWGVSYYLGEGETLLPTGRGRRLHLLLARLFDDQAYGKFDSPYNMPGALWIATATAASELVPAPAPGDPPTWMHTGSILSASVFQSTMPPGSISGTEFRYPRACQMKNGVHVLLHAEVVDDPGVPNYRTGRNIYAALKAHVVDDVASYTVVESAEVLDLLGSTHFVGGAAVSDATSVWLYPHFNISDPPPAGGLMRVLTFDGTAITITDVATPYEIVLPGWGYVPVSSMVAYLGGNKLGFIATPTPSPETGDPLRTPISIRFYLYDLVSGAVTEHGTVGDVTLLYEPGYPTAGGGIGALTVVQRESQAGEVERPAVLLWSTSCGENPAPTGTFTGTTFMSIDGGATWTRVSDKVGDSRGVSLLGNVLRTNEPGHAWFPEPPAP
jgi:hypothetical protein